MKIYKIIILIMLSFTLEASEKDIKNNNDMFKIIELERQKELKKQKEIDNVTKELKEKQNKGVKND